MPVLLVVHETLPLGSPDDSDGIGHSSDQLRVQDFVPHGLVLADVWVTVYVLEMVTVLVTLGVPGQTGGGGGGEGQLVTVSSTTTVTYSTFGAGSATATESSADRPRRDWKD